MNSSEFNYAYFFESKCRTLDVKSSIVVSRANQGLRRDLVSALI